MIKAIENYDKDELNKLARKTSIVVMSDRNKKESENFTIDKKSTSTISNDFTALTNIFNKMLSNTKTLNNLQKIQSKSNKQEDIQPIVVPAPVIGSDELSENLKTLTKIFKGLNEKFKKLNLNPEQQEENDDEAQGDASPSDGKKKKSKGRGKAKKAKAKGKLKAGRFAGKALGIFAAGMDLYDRLEGGEDLAEAGVGVAGGAAGGYIGAEAGAALGAAIGGPAAPLTGAIGGLVGGAIGYLGGGFAADTAYKAATKESPAQKNLENVAAKVATPVATQEPSELTDNSFSGRFAKYISDTFENVSNYVRGIPSSSSGKVDVENNYEDFYSGEGVGSSENAKIAMDFFQSKGFTKEQSAGIVGNLQQESGKFLIVVISPGSSKRIVSIFLNPDRVSVAKSISPCNGIQRKMSLYLSYWYL
jgi:hypothetical protein